jgi:hypothetical protein
MNSPTLVRLLPMERRGRSPRMRRERHLLATTLPGREGLGFQEFPERKKAVQIRGRPQPHLLDPSSPAEAFVKAWDDGPMA